MRRTRIVWVVGLLLLAVGIWGAQGDGTSRPLRAVDGGGSAGANHVLIPAPVRQPESVEAGGTRVLLLMAEGSEGEPCSSPLTSLLLSYGDVAAVDTIDFTYGLPSLAQLQAYNVVICWTDSSPNDPVGAGNLLADYVDAGGKVILSTFAWYQYYGLSGRIMTAAYTPLLSAADDDHYTWAGLGTYDASSPIMAGVTAVADDYRDFTTLSAGAKLVASWDDGENLVATKGCIAAINLYPGCNYNFEGDVGVLYHNTVNWLMAGCSAYDLSYQDDFGRSRVCVSSKTGAWQYTVLTGAGKGVYSGKGSVSKTTDRWTFRSVAGSPRLMLLTVYPKMFRATASLGGSDFTSWLADRNTKDDLPGCR